MSFPRLTVQELNFLQENQKLLDDSQRVHNFGNQFHPTQPTSNLGFKDSGPSFFKEHFPSLNQSRGDAVVPKFKRTKQNSFEAFSSGVLPSTSQDLFPNYFPRATMPITPDPAVASLINQYTGVPYNSANSFPLYVPMPVIRPITSKPLPSSNPFQAPSIPSHPLQLQVFPQPLSIETTLPPASEHPLKDRLVQRKPFANDNPVVEDKEVTKDFAVVSDYFPKGSKKDKAGESICTDFIVPEFVKKKSSKNEAKPSQDVTPPNPSNQAIITNKDKDSDNNFNVLPTEANGPQPAEEIKASEPKSTKVGSGKKKNGPNGSQKKLKEEKQKARLLRNRVSAQMARERKKAHIQSLEQICNELEGKNQVLEQKYQQLSQENKELREFMKGQMKVNSVNFSFSENSEETDAYLKDNFNVDGAIHQAANVVN